LSLQPFLSRNPLRIWLGIAATILLLGGMLFTFSHDFFNTTKRDNSTRNRELDYLQAQEILLSVSSEFNSGIDKLQYLGKFDKAIQKVGYFSKYYQYQSIIINPDLLQGDQ
ncbi:MAG: hypothetical protein WCL00_09195, partial [Bacteroidota bacterium]